MIYEIVEEVAASFWFMAGILRLFCYISYFAREVILKVLA